MSQIGRNDPCPCGSGQKYKKCCGRPERTAIQHEWRTVGKSLGARIYGLATGRFQAAWNEAMRPFPSRREIGQPHADFLAWWAFSHLPLAEGRTALELFEASSPELDERERKWLAAVREAWLSVWEGVSALRGQGLHLRDLLTGAERTVADGVASGEFRPGYAYLARLVHFEGFGFVNALHPVLLETHRARRLVNHFCDALRPGGRAITPELLREAHETATLVLLWEEASGPPRAIASGGPAAEPVHQSVTDPLALAIVDLLAIWGEPLPPAHIPASLRRWTAQWPPAGAVNRAVVELLREGALRQMPLAPPQAGVGVTPPVEEATQVLRKLTREGRLTSLTNALWPWLLPVGRIRAAFCLDDPIRYAEASRGTDPAPTLVDLCLHPCDAAWFSARSPVLQRAVAVAVLQGAIDALADARPLLPALEAIGDSDVGAALVDHAVMSGDLERARHLLLEDSGEAVSRGALIRFVADPAGAADVLDEALHAYRQESDGLPPLLPGLLGVCHVLARYGAGRHAEAERMARRGAKRTRSPVYETLSRMGAALSGEPTDLPEAGPGSIPLLVDALARLWSGQLTRDRVRELEHAHDRARAAGLEWLADQYAQLIVRSPTPRPMPGARFPALAEALRRQTPWERVLARMEEIAAAPRGVAAGGRIAWVLQWDGDGVVSVEAKEQLPRAGGLGWTFGRPVSPNMILQGSAARHATPQDVAAAGMVGAGRKNGFPRTLLALAGHPHLFWADDARQALQIRRGEPRLYVESAAEGEASLPSVLRSGNPHCTSPSSLAGGFRVRMHPSHAGAYFVEREGPDLVVYALSARQRQYAEALGRGIPVPSSGRKALLRTLAAVGVDVVVQSDLAAGAVRDGEADPRVFVQMSPRGGSFRVCARVRPFGTDEPSFIPGRGGRLVTDGAGRSIQRVLEREAETLAALELTDDVVGLTEALALLERIRGLDGAVVVEWPQGAGLRVRCPRPDGLGLRIRGERDWFLVDGGLALDDGQVLPLRALLAALDESGGRFVALGEGEFLALEASLRRRLEELKAGGDAVGKGGLRVHRFAAAALESVLDGGTGDAAWQAHLERLRADPVRAVPDGFRAELRDYQREGFRWLARLADWGAGACLADDMGLGKTVQALALLAGRAGPALVVAPTSVMGNWLDEAARFAPTLRPRPYAGSRRAGMLDTVADTDLVVCSYTVLQQDVETLAAVEWGTVVLDEAQAIKNVATRRAQAALKLRAGFRLATTGTPVENHLEELWSLFRFLVPGLLGSRARFLRQFALPIERDRDSEARARLQRRLAPFILRRMKSQVLAQLPARTEMLLALEPGESERALYEAVRRQAVERLEGAPERMRILAELMRLRRACCHPRLVVAETDIPSAKLAAFEEILDDLLENGHRALVFSQFTDHLGLVRERIEERGIAYQYLDGATPTEVRRERVAAFQRGEGTLFLISLRAGGTGLNLTAADYVIHLDPWWNPAVEDQASDRAHRLGQARPVTVYRLVLGGTVEEKIVKLHRHKRELAESLLEGTDAAGRLSAEELLALLRGAAAGG